MRDPVLPPSLPLPSRESLGRLAAAALLIAALMAVSAASAQPVNLPGLEGGALREADLGRGRTVVVVWASWSPRSRDVVERINALAGRWGSQARVVAVNFQEDRGEIQRFLAGKTVRVPVYLDADGAFSKRYAVTQLPGLVVVIDGRAAYTGKLPEDPDRLLADLLG